PAVGRRPGPRGGGPGGAGTGGSLGGGAGRQEGRRLPPPRHVRDAGGVAIGKGLTKVDASTLGQFGATHLTHLQQLEAESIHIIREAVAECSNPVLLYSIGKDSSVLLHLAMKAFAPGKLPFPLLHIDTTWKFRDMIAFRDAQAQRLGLDLIVHIN